MCRLIVLVLLLLAALGIAVARDYTATITWAPNEGETVQGFRVYAYTDGEKTLLYDGQDTIYETTISKPTVFGVVAYNEYGESDVVPRAAIVPEIPPNAVRFEVIMMPVEGE